MLAGKWEGITILTEKKKRTCYLNYLNVLYRI